MHDNGDQYLKCLMETLMHEISVYLEFYETVEEIRSAYCVERINEYGYSVKV